ncbi:MAG: ATP-binding cassette domain-containing protein, partial [Sphingomonas sp.]
MPAESLRFDAVTKRFGETLAVDGVSLEIAAGTFVALVGTSGSGKSTLLKTINRLIEPDGGRVLIDGADVTAGPAPALRRRIGYVFQEIGLFPHMTVAENIGIGPRIAGAAPVDVGALLDLVAGGRPPPARPPAARGGGGGRLGRGRPCRRDRAGAPGIDHRDRGARRT